MKIFFPTYARSHLPKETNFYNNLSIKYICILYSRDKYMNIYMYTHMLTYKSINVYLLHYFLNVFLKILF